MALTSRSTSCRRFVSVQVIWLSPFDGSTGFERRDPRIDGASLHGTQCAYDPGRRPLHTLRGCREPREVPTIEVMGINTTLSRLQAKFDDKDAEKGLVFAWWIPLFCVAGQ